MKEFSSRFRELDDLSTDLKVFAAPFSTSIVIDDVPPALQCELLTIRCDSELKAKYESRTSLSQFYEQFSQTDFPDMHKMAAKRLSMFGSTYLCEKLFSVMKINKSPRRATLSDSHLTAVLRIASSRSIAPNISRLLQRKGPHTSIIW